MSDLRSSALVAVIPWLQTKPELIKLGATEPITDSPLVERQTVCSLLCRRYKTRQVSGGENLLHEGI